MCRRHTKGETTVSGSPGEPSFLLLCRTCADAGIWPLPGSNRRSGAERMWSEARQLHKVRYEQRKIILPEADDQRDGGIVLAQKSSVSLIVSCADTILRCRRTHGEGEAARNEMERSEPIRRTAPRQDRIAEAARTNSKDTAPPLLQPLSDSHIPLPDNYFRILGNQFRIFYYLCRDGIGEPISKTEANSGRNRYNKLKFNDLYENQL